MSAYSIGTEFTRFSPRIPGTVNSDMAAAYIRNKLASLGLETWIEPINFMGVFHHSWKLNLVSPVVMEITSCPQNNTGFGNVAAEIIDVGYGKDKEYELSDVRGKIVLVNWGNLMDNELPCGTGKRYPLLASYDNAVTAEAAAVIGYFQDTPGNALKILEPGIKPTGGSNIPGCAETGENKQILIPVLTIGRDDALKLKKTLAEGRVSAILSVEGIRKISMAQTVVGRLPASSEAIIIGSHYCSTFEGAVCDTVGVAGTLALVGKYAKIPVQKRNKTLFFVFSGSHVWINCNIASEMFIKKNGITRKNCTAMLWMDHISAPVRYKGWRSFFNRGSVLLSFNPVMCLVAFAAMLANRKMPRLLPFSRLWTLCEMGPFDNRGIVCISLQVSDPVMLTTEDTWDKIDSVQLERDIGVYRVLLAFLMKVPSWIVRFFELPGRSLFGCGTLFRGIEMPQYQDGEEYSAEASPPLYRGGLNGEVIVITGVGPDR